jgi:hypothetical protein
MKSRFWTVIGLVSTLFISNITLVIGAEVKGKVSQVSATTLTATFDQAGLVRIGNEATVALWIEGVGAIPIRGTWRVKSISGNSAELVPLANDNAQPLVGQSVIIADTNHMIGTPPAPSPVKIEGRGNNTTAAVHNTPGTPPRVDIRFIQSRLARLGYDPGIADGVMGPKTRGAIRAYQRDYGLPIDGRVSADLHRALEIAEGNKSTQMIKGSPESHLWTLPHNDDRPTPVIMKEAKDYYFGLNGKPLDYEKSLALNRICAERGDHEAIYNVGVAYAFGNGVNKDIVMARGFFEQAAAKGNSRAAFNMATLYHNGMGVKKDDDKAMTYMRQAAEGTDPETYHGMGNFYRLGIGVEASREAAIHWYLKGAKAGDQKCKEQLEALGVAW